VAPQGTQLASSGPQVPLIAAGRIAAEMGGDGELFNVVQFAPAMSGNLAIKPPLMRKHQMIKVFNNWFGVTTQSKQPDQAWDLLAAFNRPETSLEYNRTVTSIPPRKTLAGNPFMTDPKYHLSSFVEVINKDARPQPKVPNYAECWKTMDDGLEAAWSRQQSPMDALDSVAQQWTQLLTEGYGAKS
jgi:ABC-type glycerol-3-phosphate transport system substrate-binding protein